MGEKDQIPTDKKKIPDTLERINESFALLKEEAARDGRKLDSPPQRNESAGVLDEINASFVAAKNTASSDESGQNGKKYTDEDRGNMVWSLLTVFLAIALIVATVVFFVMIYRGGTRDQVDVNSEKPSVSEEQQDSSETVGMEESEEQTSKDETEKQTEAVEVKNAVPKEYEAILTKQEKEEWENRQVDSSRLFVQLNQKIRISNKEKVYLRLINPPYSAFGIQVRIYTKDDPETVLYQSKVLDPGTILDYVSFDALPEPGEYEAGVEYIIYDDMGNKFGTHEVTVQIVVQE